jgi:hypothetical protein
MDKFKVEGSMLLHNSGTTVPDYSVITQKATTKIYQSIPTFHMG